MIRVLSKLTAYIASLLLVGLCCLILVEIVGRSFFDYSTMIADEYSGYLYLSLVFLGLGYTFLENGHIRITLLTSKLSSKMQKFADIFVSLVLLAILAFCIYYGYLLVKDSYEMEMVSENVSETPLYLTQIPLVLGVGVFMLSVVSFIVKRVKNDI